MEHGRLYRFTCQSCDTEYIAVGSTNDDEARSLARANGWDGEDDLWYCGDCKWDGDDPGDGFVWLPGGGSTVM